MRIRVNFASAMFHKHLAAPCQLYSRKALEKWAKTNVSVTELCVVILAPVTLRKWLYFHASKLNWNVIKVLLVRRNNAEVQSGSHNLFWCHWRRVARCCYIRNEVHFSEVHRCVNYIGSLAKFTWTPSVNYTGSLAGLMLTLVAIQYSLHFNKHQKN